MKLKTGTSPTRSGFMTDLKWALKNWPLYAMFIPGFILTFLFAYLPMFGIVIAFKKINLRDGIFGSPWVGLSNFRALFRNDSVWEAIRNTLSYNIVFILTGLLFAVALAITLNLIRNKIASKIYQTVYIMPHFLSMVIIAYLVFAFLNMESGFINNSIIPMIMGENAQKVNWYAKAEAWPIILFIVKTWQSVGYSRYRHRALRSRRNRRCRHMEADNLHNHTFFKNHDDYYDHT